MTRIEVGVKPHLRDSKGENQKESLKKFLGIPIKNLRIIRSYTIDKVLPMKIVEEYAKSALADPISETFSINKPLSGDFDWICEIYFKPGVTDNEGRTATEALNFMIDEQTEVYFSQQYRFLGNELTIEHIKKAIENYLANPLIQTWKIASFHDFKGFEPHIPKVISLHEPIIKTYDLSSSLEQWLEWSKKNVWALKQHEIEAILQYFKSKKIQSLRKDKGLSINPTDVEIECIAQSWSEHCKHKIFASKITYTDENNNTHVIDGLFNTYIKGATQKVRELKGKNDQCLSVFTDNAGVVEFNKEWALVFKVETHNSPSSLDPYGGALTGIVGVNRDPFGTGLGANPLFNTNVFCLANPFTTQVPKGLLHPLRILEGVRLGVEHGGNQSGIPTINGSVLFHEGYIGKPVIYAGTGAIMPKNIHGKEGYKKYPKSGDIIVMVGGRIGKDGIHGATFSSEELSKESPISAVQIGDPITQKRMFDFLLKARDLGLYSAITDNGAGGLSSSVGEMAILTGGAKIDLSKPPLKYHGLDPWEILVSESQERMTLAVPPENLNDFIELSNDMRVESTPIGEFTNTGFFEILFKDKLVGLLDLEFLHKGVPRLELSTTYVPKPINIIKDEQLPSINIALPKLMGSLNIASKEYWVRQYDHEVKGGSVVKPLVGNMDDGPSDGAVWRPFLDSYKGVVVSHGIVPRYSTIDAYAMTQAAFDEAVRNAICVGGDPTTFSALDNFAWPDPLLNAPNWEWKLSSLVRANQALYDMCITYQIPLISGKDSMKNDARLPDGSWISILPTLLISLIGHVPDIRKSMTMDLKNIGDWIYVIGITKREIGASEYSFAFNLKETTVPKIDNPQRLFNNYNKLHKAISQGLISSAHDLSDGGLLVAASESAFAGNLGMEIDLKYLNTDSNLSDEIIAFSESQGRILVSVHPRYARKFERIMENSPISRIGIVIPEPRLIIHGKKQNYSFDINELKRIWKQSLAL